MTCILLLLIPTSGREGPLPLSVILTSQSSAQQACTRAPSFCGEHPRLCKPSPFLCPSPFPAGLARYRSDNFQESWEVPKIIIFPVTVLPKAGPGADNPPRAGWWLRQLGALRCKPCTIYGHFGAAPSRNPPPSTCVLLSQCGHLGSGRWLFYPNPQEAFVPD